MHFNITTFKNILFRAKCINIKDLAFIIICLFSGNITINAATITATSIADLQTKINSAASGDIINLTNGHYTNNTISISKSNITVQAATAGGVYLDGTNAITISGNNNTFGGFQFTTNTLSNGQIVENPTNVVTVTGNSNTITQLNFNGYSASKMIQLEGQFNVVSFCNFQNKPALNNVNHGGDGDMVQIIPNATNPGYNTIRYCSFQHMPGFGGDFGNECIRIGDGVYSTYISRTVVEYCYFEDTGLGDSEAISVKSMENTLRYNTMNNNPNAMFCFRNGDNNVAYGNFFINSGGVRCKQANNVWIYNNYFEMAGTGQDNSLPGSGAKAIYFLTYSGYNNNYNVLHNTFYKCGESEIQSGMTNCTWANNAFYSNSGSIFSSASTTSGETFLGNLYSGTLGLSIASGMTNADPKLTLNSDGYYGLSATSPAINAASSNYPAMLSIPLIDTLALDIQGQYRPTTRTQKDVGCEEYSATGTVLNKPLAVTNVGPSYLGGPATPTLTDQNIIFNPLPSKTAGDANFAPGAYSTSGLTVSYTSSNTAVATIVNSQIHIVGGGTSTITASQTGNSSYNAATSATQTLTVSKQNQTITFGSLPTKLVTDADFSAGATASSGLTVSLSSSNTAVATIVSGQIHIVGAGTSTITASQAGNPTYNAATNVTQTLTVNKLSQTITFGAIATKLISDADFNPGATASSSLTVTYTSSNPAVATIVSNQIHIVGAGTSTITASQAGSSTYNAATSVAQTLTVNKLSQTITFAALASKITTDADFSPGATASSTLAVTYASSNTAVATIVSNQIHIIGVGTTTITASQAGNTTYNAAPDISQSLTVNNPASPQTITFNPLPTKTYGDTDFAPGATASSGLTVTYSSSNSSVATIVSGQIHIVGAGASDITASQAGNVTYNAASNVIQTLTVNKKLQTITFGTLPTKLISDVDFAPGATAGSGLTVTYSSSNTAVATIVSNQIHIVSAGTTTITASQAGDSNNNAATDVPQTLTVNKLSQTITFGALATKLITDADFSAGATASSGLGISLASSNTAVATIVSGQIHIVGAGTSTITASQTGNSTYNAASDVTQTLTVNKLSQTITFGSLAKKCTADVDFNPGASTSSGLTITYSSSNTSIATIVSGLVHIVGAGVTTITASQSGSSSYNTATNVSQSFTVEEVTNVSITLNPVADAYVWGTNTTTNYGTATDLAIKKGANSTGDRLIYMQFDITGQNIYSISSAKVRLYSNSKTGTVGTSNVVVSQASDSWTETGITYGNCPGKGTDITSVSITAAGAYYEWDITSYIQSQFTANDNLISLIFNNLVNDGVIDHFNSKEAASNAPQLYITLNKVVTRVTGTTAASSLTLTQTSDVKVLSGGLLTIDTPTSVKSINVASGGKLTQNSGQTLNVSTLTIQSDVTGTGTFVDNNTSNLQAKSATVQQYLTAGRNWYISSPVSAATSNVFSASSLYPLYWYDEAHGSTVQWATITDTSTPLSVMKGYVAKMASDGVVTFNGTLNNGSQTINIYRTTGQSKAGFNLVGNPYVSYLDWDQVSKSNLLTSIWQRTKNAANNYVFDTYNSTGQQYLNNSGKGVNNHIPPMQAFWVRVDNGFSTGSLTVDNTMRSHNGNANILGSTVNDPVFKSSSSNMDSQSVLRLQVSTGSNTDETLIYSNPSASNNFDAYDTPKMFNDSGTIAEIYTVVGIENVAINGLNSLPYDTEIPLGFNSFTAGEFSIKATQIYNFNSGTQIILKDYLDINNPVITDLSDGSSYLFSSDVSTYNTNRFSLIFHAPSLETGISNSINNGTAWVSINSNGQISLNGSLKGETNVTIFNEVGQKLFSKNFTETKQAIDYQLIPGIYIVSVTNAGKSITTKILAK
ncbi:MAG: DNRLRE domain-containing protein [Paludibacter sp.]